jgi:putative tricarboxylic transport membrane protein
MTGARPEAARPPRNASAGIVGLAVIALGGFVLQQALAGVNAQIYAQVGPGVFPAVVGVGLVLVGLGLLLQAARGRWQVAWTQRDGAAAHVAQAPSPLAKVLLVGVGLAADVVLMSPLGFVAASTVLFACVTRAFGSRRLASDTLAGLIFAGLIFLIFTRGLGLSLPVGSVWESLAWTR